MDIFYQTHPDIVFAKNTFRNVPTILQFGNTPMLEVVKFEKSGYSVRFPIYYNDGTKIAVVVGSRIHVTPEGAKANIKMRHEIDLTVCELEGQQILELRRDPSPALHGTAELYAPNGALLKANSNEISAIVKSGIVALPPGMVVEGNTFDGSRVGILYTENGIYFGVNVYPPGTEPR